MLRDPGKKTQTNQFLFLDPLTFSELYSPSQTSDRTELIAREIPRYKQSCIKHLSNWWAGRQGKALKRKRGSLPPPNTHQHVFYFCPAPVSTFRQFSECQRGKEILSKKYLFISFSFSFTLRSFFEVVLSNSIFCSSQRYTCWNPPKTHQLWLRFAMENSFS